MTIDIVKGILILIILILLIIIFKEKRSKGIIFWSKDKDGTNIWAFKFRDGITYDKLENDKYITFKIVKKEKVYKKYSVEDIEKIWKDEKDEIQV